MMCVCARSHRYDDQKLWHALEVSHLKEGIMKLEGKLDARVSEGGVWQDGQAGRV
jgi:ABC-type multidrug transport system fused ATPase/permease subunit